MPDLLTQQVMRQQQARAAMPPEVERNRMMIRQLMGLEPGRPNVSAMMAPGLMQMGTAALPGAGDAMAAMDSQRAGQRMVEAFQAGNYGEALGGGLEALGHGLGALPMVPAFGAMVKAYHGSPHRFDRFDMSKIGTGEGAQAYGHGLYFAENPEVAGSYRNAGQPAWIGRGPQGPGGLYNVTLDVEPEDLLDWDAPLSQQSEKVRKALEAVGFNEPPPRQMGYTAEGTPRTTLTGGEIYRMLAKTDAEASRMLADAGIPGIRYFDAGSRGKGEGTRNVVMFRDDLIKIEGVE